MSRAWMTPELRVRMAERAREVPIERSSPRADVPRTVPSGATLDAEEWSDEPIRRAPVVTRDLSDWEGDES